MTYSEIKLTFSGIPATGTHIDITDSLTYAMSCFFKPVRDNEGYYTNSQATLSQFIIQFANEFGLDNNSTGLYDISTNTDDNYILIKANNPSSQFTVPNNDTFVITANITNFAGTVLSIDNVALSEATINPVCTHYKVSVTTNELATVISSPYVDASNTNNPFTFEVLRGQGFYISCENAEGQVATDTYLASSAPKLLNSGYFNVTVTASPNGGTVVITPLQSFNQTIEYSLDNTNWKTENQFTGLSEGDYTLFVRDNYGCSFNQSFSVDAFGNVRTYYFLMPKENSIRFANRITWGDAANYKTDENTLSCEADVKKPYKEIQQFQTADVITTQFHTGHSEVLAAVIKEDGTEVNIPVIKVSNYMGLKDKRDARKYNLGNDKTGIYFTVGNIYDYTTGVDTGNDYILNGLLPEWAEVGTYINIDSGWYIIEDIVFDETVNAQVCVISNTYTGSDVLIQVAAVYNLENYEEYEFTIDFVNFINETVKVRVNANDTVFDNIVQLSEDIEVKVRHENTYEIRYKNTKNTNINYSRGLENKLRLLVEKVAGSPSEDSETNKTDTTARLTSSTVYELDKFIFSPVTKQMMRKIILALSHDTVMINGITYVKNDGIEVSDALEDTNLYEITATMIKGNNAFSSNVAQGSNAVNGGAIEIPGLIESDSGYVSY